MQKYSIIIVMTMMLLSGCSTTKESQSSTFSTLAPAANSGDIEAAIQSSLRYLKWNVLERGEGYIIAKVGNLQWNASSKAHKRDPFTASAQDKIRTATARITFNDTGYSIYYIASEGMDDGSNSHIWKRWAKNLDRDIRIGLNLPPINN